MFHVTPCRKIHTRKSQGRNIGKNLQYSLANYGCWWQELLEQMVHDEFIRTCPDTQFHNNTKCFTLFAQMMPYPNITLKISSMRPLKIYVIITHAFYYKLKIRMILMIKLWLTTHKILQRYPKMGCLPSELASKLLFIFKE